MEVKLGSSAGCLPSHLRAEPENGLDWGRAGGVLLHVRSIGDLVAAVVVVVVVVVAAELWNCRCRANSTLRARDRRIAQLEELIVGR